MLDKSSDTSSNEANISGLSAMSASGSTVEISPLSIGVSQSLLQCENAARAAGAALDGKRRVVWVSVSLFAAARNILNWRFGKVRKTAAQLRRRLTPAAIG
ncbi:MAG TPA: hypothetical protein VI077_03200, partial [Pseudolabrys sp.]